MSKQDSRGKKKIRVNGSDDEYNNNITNIVNVDDNIVYEILSRLPVKSLMRFKCVSKQWSSMVLNDRYLIDLHFRRSKAQPRLLIKVPTTRTYNLTDHDDILDPDPEGCCLVTVDLLFKGGEVSPVVHTIRELDTPSCRIAGPLNGLICFFDPEENQSVQVCNLSTREVTPWIKSTYMSNLYAEDKDKYHICVAMCNLGFDPATKEHKVICIWFIDGTEHQVCEVLSVGDSKWRRIDDVPSAYNLREYLWGSSIYVNGSIYYISKKLTGCVTRTGVAVKDDAKRKVVMVFDVGEEKFRAIRIPDFILDQILYDRYQPIGSIQLLEIDGHPALLSRISSRIAKMWLFDDAHSNGCRSNTWTEVTIELPVYWGKQHYVRFHSVIGTDLIILYLFRCNKGGGVDKVTRYSYNSQYSYNWKKKILMEIKINGLPSSVPYLSYVSGVSTFVESLSPVQKLPKQD